MTSRNTKDEGSSFGKLVIWTLALALVFSAGLITGQRLLRRSAMPPMVSLSSTTNASPEAKAAGEKVAEATPTATESLRTTFSFYDHLTAAPDDRPTTKKPPAAKKAAEEEPAEESEPAEASKPVDDDEESAPTANEDTAEPADQPADQPADEPARDEKPAGEVAEKSASEPAPDEESKTTGVLDTISNALGRVDDESDEDESAKDEAPALPARYTLQVSSHPDRDSAEREMTRLRKIGVEPHVVVVEVPGKGKLWRIRVGKFHAMDEARNFQRSLKAKRGVPGFVTPL